MIFAIRGKLMRTVPVILYSELVECLQIILKYRNNAKVTSKNLFLIGIPSDNKKRFKYLRACVLLRTFAEDCGAKLPHSLRGTQLRKHIETYCISLNLSEDQVTDLANFMGHDKRIHKSHYRQPIPELEILRTTQFLEAAQGGIEEENEEENEEKMKKSILMIVTIVMIMVKKIIIMIINLILRMSKTIQIFLFKMTCHKKYIHPIQRQYLKLFIIMLQN